MDKAKREKLEAAGFKIGSVQDFLGLSEEDMEYVEMKVALAAALKKQRTALRISQNVAAKRLHSSQSRIAKMEGADKSVTVDLILKSIFGLGGTRATVAAAICPTLYKSNPVTCPC